MKLRFSFAQALRFWLLPVLLVCQWASAHAQVTYYTDEGTFNAATASLQSVTETYEGLAPAGGKVQNPKLPSGYVVGPDGYVADGTYDSARLSLNGSASDYSELNEFSDTTVYIYTNTGPVTAFGTEIGLLDPNGGDIAYGSDFKAYDYPLTDTIEVGLYTGLAGDGSGTGQVGKTFQAGTIANGFVGAVSTVPFQYVIVTVMHHDTLYDANGYQLADPYAYVLDNTSFAQAPTLPTVTVTGSSPDADAGTGQTGDFVVTLSAPAATDLKVAYTVKGSAKPGVDYVALKGVVKIKAGKTSKAIAVVPAGDLGGAGKKVVKLTLQPGTGYLVGTPDPVKVKITDTHVIILP